MIGEAAVNGLLVVGDDDHPCFGDLLDLDIREAIRQPAGFVPSPTATPAVVNDAVGRVPRYSATLRLIVRPAARTKNGRISDGPVPKPITAKATVRLIKIGSESWLRSWSPNCISGSPSAPSGRILCV